MTSGTFAPLQNKREYIENEKIVLDYFFTNTDRNIYCAKNTLSNQLWAFLVGQYSRSQLSMRDRFLQLFDDSLSALEKGIITKDEYVSLDDLANSIKKSKVLNLDFFEKKASDFLKKWGVDYGHNSLKDADRIRFAIEGVSQVFAKIIESPFPALGDFQEKSTRYLNFSNDSMITPDDLKKSKYTSEILRLQKKAMDIYINFTPKVKNILLKNKIIKESDFSSTRAFENTLNAKTFDIMRYILPSNISTSIGVSFSTRILESHLSYMLSCELEEIRLIASFMYKEALKLSPGLLSHVGVNEYELKRRSNLKKYFDDFFEDEEDDEVIGFYAGIDNNKRVNLIFEGDLDNSICASILFESGRKYGLSFSGCLDLVEDMDLVEKEELISLALKDRGPHDRMPRALQHSSVMFEFLCDFGAYRDIQRHRASFQIWQGATAIHGYDYPEYIDLPGMEEFRDKYDEIMTEITILSRKVIKENEYLSEYVSCLGHLVRTTFEMNPGQLAYVLELRTTPWGHYSYRKLFLEVYKIIKKEAPIFAKFIRVGSDLTESSRKIQEEKAEQKRKSLGI